MIYSVNPNTAIYKAFTATSADVGVTIGPLERWLVTTDAAVMIAQGATPTAAKASGSTLVVPGYPLIVQGGAGAKLAAIRAGGSDGQLTVTRMLDA